MTPSARARRCTRTSSKIVSSSPIEFLPMHVLVDIFARVASTSFNDLLTMKLCCKEFHEATEDDYVFKHVLFPRDRFGTIQWCHQEKIVSFLKHCGDCGNPDALYVEGMVNYFSHLRRREGGFDNLRRAAEKGHLEACYVLGVILARYNTKGKSVELLKLLRDVLKKSNTNIRHLRKKVEKIVRQMWVTNRMEDAVEAHRCNICQARRRDLGWDLDQGRDELCSWECEVKSFHDMLLGCH
ncbi:hypothetical protein Dimus_015217 [Dionaea muscipula]